MTTHRQTPAKAGPQRYIVTNEWLKDHDAVLTKQVVEVLVRDLTNRLARSFAQAGADAMSRYYNERGRLIPEGTRLKVKTVIRDHAGRITAVVDEDVIAHETAGAGR